MSTLMLGCASTDAEVRKPENYGLEQLWELHGFSEPESVFTFPGHPWIYVSNPNGRNDPGFISRISRDGKLDTLRWVEGLGLPTGMNEFAGDLYVVDLTKVVQIDLETGDIVKEYASDIDSKGLGPAGTPVVLNDIAISTDGTLYVTALGAGIYVSSNDSLVAWSSLKSGAGLISVPNGIVAGEDALYVGSMGASFEAIQNGEFGPIMKASYIDGSFEPLVGVDGPYAGWDGLDFFGEGFIASSPPTGDIWYIRDGRGTLVGNVGIDNQISDTGIDVEEQILFAPMLRTNKVVAYQLTGFD